MPQHWPKAEAWGRIRTEIRKYIKISSPYCPTQFFQVRDFLTWKKMWFLHVYLASVDLFSKHFPVSPWDHTTTFWQAVPEFYCVLKSINFLLVLNLTTKNIGCFYLLLWWRQKTDNQFFPPFTTHDILLGIPLPQSFFFFFFEIRKFQHAQISLMRKLSNAFDDIAPILLLDKLELKTILYTWLHGFI